MKRRLALILSLLAFIVPSWPAAQSATPLTAPEQEVKDALHGLLQRQDAAALGADERSLPPIYTRQGSGDAHRHMLARKGFLRAWQSARRLKIEGARVDLRTPGVKFHGADEVRISAVVSEEFQYKEAGVDGVPEAFGVGTRRWYVLRREDGHWRIRAEEYTDPLDQDTRIPGEVLPETGARPALSAPVQPSPRPTAAPAVEYADAYCGAATGCGNGGHYNPRYNDFNGEGGDCTNFISQSLRAGGFRPSGEWAWHAAKSDGTRAWSNAEGLYYYLTGSGRGHLVASGTYSALARADDVHASPISRVRPGDVIAYRERGKIVHLAIATARSAGGYLLVNSHTADRYHVPWDIGWDRSTRFLLVHLNYPGERRTAVTPG